MAARRIVRLDLEGREVRKPLRCIFPGAIAAEPGIRTIEQCIAMLLIDGESAEGDSDRRVVTQAGKVVGYIDLSEVVR